jgi:PAS domain S-box-containing protein
VYLDENNEKIGAFAMVTDITERKLAEEAIKNSERRLKTILETADEGFQLINTNLEVIDLNPKMCTIMGREKDDVIGKTIFDFVDEENKKIFLEQIELRKQGISSAYEIALSRPDGSNVNCLFNVTPLFDENNERIGAFAMVTDITERKQAEEAMKESEARTRLILNSAGEGIFGVNAEGHVVFINPGAVNMLGFEEKELLGKKIHALIHHTRADGTDYPVETCPMYAAYHVGTEHFIGDEVLWRKDGTSFPVEYAAKPILQNGQLRGAVVSFRDITERLKSEEELNERLEELEQFSRLVVGRETKMIGLKEEVNSLLKQLSQEEKYEIVQ